MLKVLIRVSACVENLIDDINIRWDIVRNNTRHYLKPGINPREKLTTITQRVLFRKNPYAPCSVLIGFENLMHKEDWMERGKERNCTGKETVSRLRI